MYFHVVASELIGVCHLNNRICIESVKRLIKSNRTNKTLSKINSTTGPDADTPISGYKT